MKEVNLRPLREAIRQYKMMDIWGDSIQSLTPEQRQQKARAKAFAARDMYIRLMSSAKNNGGADYKLWALKKALGLRTSRRYTAQAVGGKHWRAWGPRKAQTDDE